jgi:predicted phosphate transport protein (TIGR00153 family)
MRSLFGKESTVEKYSKLHVELVHQSAHKLKDVMEHFTNGKFDLMDKEVEEITRIENAADDIRRKMEVEFYHGAFLPFDREDRIILAELVDKVADEVQSAGYAISLGKIDFPQPFKEDFMELTEISFEAVSMLKDCVELLEKDLSEALSKAHEVEIKEEDGDKIERKIITKLYKAYRNKEIGILKFLELKDITQKIGNVADRSEDASDRVPIIAAKRNG